MIHQLKSGALGARALRGKMWGALGATMLALCAVPAHAQVSYTGGTYTQNFNNLLSTVPADNTLQPASVLPNGWTFVESGTNANTTLRVDNGTSGTGDTYLYGATSSNERAFGSYASGSLTSIFGASFVNNTGATLNAFSLTYTGEQWKDGGSGAAVLNVSPFSYGIGNSAVNAGDFTNVTQLDLKAVVNNTSKDVALDGNAAANQTNPSFQVTGISWAPGQTLVIRWSDPNDPGNDDGLSVDDVSFSATAATNTAPTLGNGILSGSTSGSYSYQLKGADVDGDTLTYSVTGGALPAGLTLSSSGLITGTPTTTGTTQFTATVTDPSGATGTGTYNFTINANADGIAPTYTRSAIPSSLTRDQLAAMTLSGTVQDLAPGGQTASGVRRVQIQLRRNSDNTAYNGSAFTSSQSPFYLATLSGGDGTATATLNWSRSLSFVPSASVLAPGTYSLYVVALDNAGNYAGNIASFTIIAQSSNLSSGGSS